jgi:alcohol dehydrogenase class IV
MPAAFEFATAARIVFGAGRAQQLGGIAAEYGRRALVIVSNAQRTAPLLALLQAAGVQAQVFEIKGEPTIALARAGRSMALQVQAEMVIGIGGGSVIDAAKAIAALATNPHDPMVYLEVIGEGQPLKHAPLPIIAVPTTAGTGSEVTRNAVLASSEHQVKVSMRHPLMLPRVALVDPELTYGLSAAMTAATGMDALTQNIEPYTCISPNPMTDALSAEGIRRAAGALRRASQPPDDAAARADMALASLLGGLSLANARLGAVHGFAAPIGGMFPAPHGAVCAALLAPVMTVNVAAARSAGMSDLLRRYADVACWLTGRADASPEDGIAWVRDLTAELAIPRLSAYGVGAGDVPAIVEKAAVASSMKGNPVALSHEQLAAALQAAL